MRGAVPRGARRASSSPARRLNSAIATAASAFRAPTSAKATTILDPPSFVSFVWSAPQISGRAPELGAKGRDAVTTNVAATPSSGSEPLFSSGRCSNVNA